MGSLYAKDVVETALNEIGYEAEGSNHKYTIYSAELDKVNYFNGPKNGIADWCAIFVIWCMYANTRNANGEIDADKWDAQYFQYQPDRSTAAGVGYMADFYQQNDAWTDNPERGDVVTFRNYAHTGLVVDWGYNEDLGCEGFWTVEGNINGGYVGKRFYRYDDPDIDGFGRPRYDGWAYDEDDSDDEPTPMPAPEPTPTPEPEEPCTVNLRVLSRGSTGEQVNTLKALLNEFGYAVKTYNGKPMPLDGDFDYDTEQAVYRFQENHGMEKNGIVDEKFWNLLLK